MDHAKLGELDVFRHMIHVEHVARRRHTIRSHPKQARARDGHVIPCRRHGSKEHNPKGGNHQGLGLAAKEKVVTDGRENVGDVLKHGDHGHRVGLERRHACKQHGTKQEIDGSPSASNVPGERRVTLDPTCVLASLDANHGHDSLKDDQKDIEITGNQVIVALE